MTSIKVGNRNLGTYNYNTVTGVLNSQTYGNGDTVTYTYDNLGRVKTTTYSDGLTIYYAYSGEGDLYSVTSWKNIILITPVPAGKPAGTGRKSRIIIRSIITSRICRAM